MAQASGIISAARQDNDPASTLNAGATPTGINAPANPAATGPAQPAQGAAPASPATTPATPAVPDYSGQLSGLYQSELGRAPDQAGMDFWKTQMGNGTSIDAVKSAMDGSTEYKGLHPTAPGTVTPGTAPNGAATYTPAQLGTPTAWNVTGNQTVAGQLTNIMDPNSPIIQQARTQGLELANERGLMNSSIGESAAMNSAYTAAMPIAQADAATHAKAAGYNADETNQFAVKNVDAANTAGAFNANQTNAMGQAQLSAQTQTSIANLQAQTSINLANLDHATQTNLASLSNENQVKLATIQGQYQTLTQSNASAANLFSQVTQNIATISQSKDMDGAAKQAAVDNQLQLLKNGMSINGAISNLNLTDLLNFSTPAATPPATPADNALDGGP